MIMRSTNNNESVLTENESQQLDEFCLRHNFNITNEYEFFHAISAFMIPKRVTMLASYRVYDCEHSPRSYVEYIKKLYSDNTEV